jgi:ATP-dependent helicase HrpA
LNPVKDLERLRQITPYQEALNKLRARSLQSPALRREIENLRWMIEEFKVSLFAQELGTAMPVSAKRLDQQLEIIQRTQ